MLSSNTVKLVMGLVMFETWVGLVVFHVAGAEDLISICKDGLLGLGLYHIGDTAGQRRSVTQFPNS